jgi:hypothetical protein
MDTTEIDINIFNITIQRMRCNLINIYKNCKFENYPDIKKYSNNAKRDMDRFIANINIPINILSNEREVNKNNLLCILDNKNIEMLANTDTESVKSDIFNILIDIDIIIYLINTNNIGNSIMNISHLDNLILKLNEYNSFKMESTNIKKENYTLSPYNIESMADISPKSNNIHIDNNTRHLRGSQDINDKTSTYTHINRISNKSNNININDSLSHSIESDYIPNTIKPVLPVLNNFMDGRKENMNMIKKMLSNKLIDTNSKTSLL